MKAALAAVEPSNPPSTQRQDGDDLLRVLFHAVPVLVGQTGTVLHAIVGQITAVSQAIDGIASAAARQLAQLAVALANRAGQFKISRSASGFSPAPRGAA